MHTSNRGCAWGTTVHVGHRRGAVHMTTLSVVATHTHTPTATSCNHTGKGTRPFRLITAMCGGSRRHGNHTRQTREDWQLRETITDVHALLPLTSTERSLCTYAYSCGLRCCACVLCVEWGVECCVGLSITGLEEAILTNTMLVILYLWSP